MLAPPTVSRAKRRRRLRRYLPFVLRRVRVGAVFVILTAAAVAAASDQAPARPVSAAVQARATIRIISGVELHFGDEARVRDGFIARDSVIRSAGAEQPVKLLEFQ